MRVLMICDKQIFGQGLNALLEQQGAFEMLDPVAAEGQGDLTTQIELLRPDVVIMDCHNDEADPTPPLMRCLRSGCVQKIITVNLQDNLMCVFTSERRLVKEVGNLVDAITGGTHA